MLELRAVTELASVQCKLDRISEAQEMLAPIYRGFTEGHEEPDLVDAARLLNQVLPAEVLRR
jgi:hypothetical protein